MNIDDLDPKQYKVVDSKPLNIDDLDPNSYQVQEPGVYDKYVKPVVDTGLGLMNKLSSYTDAPMRAAVAEEEKNGLAGKPLTAFYNQMGQPTSTAPTSKQVYGDPMGLSNNWTVRWPYSDFNPTVNEVGSEATNMVMNPLNLIGGGEAKALNTEERASGQGFTAAEKAAQAPGLVGAAAEKVVAPVRAAASSAGEATSGINKNLINTYSKDTPQVNDLINKYRGDFATHQGDMKNGWNSTIQKTKDKLNKQITSGLEDSSKYNNVDVTDVANALEIEKGKLNPVTQPDAVAQIDKHIDMVKKLSDVVTDEPATIEVPWEKTPLTPETPIYRGKHPDNGKGDWSTNDPNKIELTISYDYGILNF